VWLRNAYANEYLETLHVDTDRGTVVLEELAQADLGLAGADSQAAPDPADDLADKDDLLDGLPINDGAREIAKLVMEGHSLSEACLKLGRGVNQPPRWRRQMVDALEQAGRL
jgi:hypothetical protein